MVDVKYAYVSYVGTNERDIVPIENIKNFCIDKHDTRTKYKIKWNNNWYSGSVAFYGATEEEVREKTESSRPKVVADSILVSNSEPEEPESCKRKFDAGDAPNPEQQAILQKKLKLLASKQCATNKITKETPSGNENLPPYNTTPRGISAASCGVNDNIPASISITSTNTKSKEVVDTKKRLFENKNNSEDVLKLKLENQKLKADNKDLQQQLKDSQMLNIELQKQVINVVGEMQEQLSRLLNREVPIVQEDEHLGYPSVGFIKNSDNSIHIGRDVWLKCQTYDTIVYTSSTPSRFVKQMATAIFGGRILKNSSVTGRVSNRKINKADCAPPRPKLDSSKLMAIEDIFRHWLTYTKKLNPVQVNAFVTKVPSYITKKISQLNTPIKKVQKIINESEERDVDESSNYDLDDVVELDQIKMLAAATSPLDNDDTGDNSN